MDLVVLFELTTAANALARAMGGFESNSTEWEGLLLTRSRIERFIQAEVTGSWDKEIDRLRVEESVLDLAQTLPTREIDIEMLATDPAALQATLQLVQKLAEVGVLQDINLIRSDEAP
jgi:hypothetical protein